MNEVRVLRLMSGEDIVATVLDSDNLDYSKVRLKDPQLMLMQPAGEGRLSFMFVPFFPFVKERVVEVAKTYVVVYHEPATEILNKYNELYGSGLIIAQPGTVPPPDAKGRVPGARIL